MGSKRKKLTARQLRKIRSAAAKKGWETRRARVVFVGGDKDNALGERYDFAFDAVSEQHGIFTNEQWQKIIDRAKEKGSVNLKLTVATLHTDTRKRDKQEYLYMTVRGNWTAKEIRAAIYANFREHIRARTIRRKNEEESRVYDYSDDGDYGDVDDGEGYEGDANTVLLLGGVSFAR